MTARVLIAEDDPTVQRLLCDVLERQDLEVAVVSDGRDVVREAAATAADLVVLDLGLPGRDGLDIIEDLRRQGNVAIVVVSGRAAEGERVLGLQLGADDYVTKPFSPRELAARVSSVLRRTRPEASTVVSHGALTVDTTSREVRYDGVLVPLTRLEFDLLELFARSPRRAWTRAELLKAVWRSSPDWQTEATVTEIVRRVRSKLDAHGAPGEWIQTVRGVGYQFNPVGAAVGARGA